MIHRQRTVHNTAVWPWMGLTIPYPVSGMLLSSSDSRPNSVVVEACVSRAHPCSCNDLCASILLSSGVSAGGSGIRFSERLAAPFPFCRRPPNRDQLGRFRGRHPWVKAGELGGCCHAGRWLVGPTLGGPRELPRPLRLIFHADRE